MLDPRSDEHWLQQMQRSQALMRERAKKNN
jgi:hypothetical protein